MRQWQQQMGTDTKDIKSTYEWWRRGRNQRWCPSSKLCSNLDGDKQGLGWRRRGKCGGREHECSVGQARSAQQWQLHEGQPHHVASQMWTYAPYRNSGQGDELTVFVKNWVSWGHCYLNSRVSSESIFRWGQNSLRIVLGLLQWTEKWSSHLYSKATIILVS